MLFQSTCGKSVSRLTGNPLCCQRQLHHYITPKSINNQELNNRSPKKGEERNDMKQIEKWLQDNNITYRLAKWGNPVYQWWILCIWFTGNIWFLSWSKRTHKNCHIWAVHAPKTHLCIQHTGNTPPYKLRDGTQTEAYSLRAKIKNERRSRPWVTAHVVRRHIKTVLPRYSVRQPSAGTGTFARLQPHI